MKPTHELEPRIEEFLTSLRARNLSKNTLRAYERDVRQFVGRLGENPTTEQITRKALRSFVSSLHGKVGAKTVRRMLESVKSFCRWLENEGLIDELDVIDAPRQKQTLPDVPSEADMSKLLDGDMPGNSPERDRVMLELLYGSGLRVEELVGINLADVVKSDVLLIRGKGKRERLVPFGEPAQAALKAWLPVRKKLLEASGQKTDALTFSVGPNQSSERLTTRSVVRVLKGVARARGFDPEKWHPHLLRHACGTHMHDHGASLQAVAQMLGHAKLSTAQIYTRVSVGRMNDVYKRAHPHSAA